MRVRDRLRERRAELGFTQEQIAANAGMNVTQYNAYERGRSAPSQVTLPRLAVALKTTEADLLGEDGAAASRGVTNGSRRNILKHLKTEFQARIAAELGLDASEVSIRIELL